MPGPPLRRTSRRSWPRASAWRAVLARSPSAFISSWCDSTIALTCSRCASEIQFAQWQTGERPAASRSARPTAAARPAGTALAEEPAGGAALDRREPAGRRRGDAPRPLRPSERRRQAPRRSVSCFSSLSHSNAWGPPCSLSCCSSRNSVAAAAVPAAGARLSTLLDRMDVTG